MFHPEYDLDVLPAHVYLRSVHNISIERAWLRLRLDFGNNAVFEYQKGSDSGIFHPEDPLHLYACFLLLITTFLNFCITSQLSQWLWSKVLQRELDNFMSQRNGQKMRKDNEKAGPSGCSRNDAFNLPESFGLTNRLLPLNDDQLTIVSEIMEAMGGEALLDFVPPEFSVKCEAAYNSLGVAELTMQNAWRVFEALLSLL